MANNSQAKTIRIGAGAAWWGDRVEPAALNAEKGALDYLCFETMAEATVSAAQVRARRDPSFEGYDTYLDDRMRATREGAVKVGREVDGMAVSGIAHTGKRVPHADRTREVIGVWSALVPREHVPSSIQYFES